METLPTEINNSGSEISAPMSEDVLKAYMDSLFKDMSMPQAIAFARMANQKGLNWETRQIYPMKVKSGNGAETVVSMVSIDGFITLAERTGHYGGIINSRLRVRMKDGSKATIPVSEFDPDDVEEIISGTVEVVRKDWPHPQEATALFRSYARLGNDGKPYGLWKKLPERMVLKCAESLALRKAFAQDLSGLYTPEEMDQARNEMSSPLSRPRKNYGTTVTPNAQLEESEAIEIQVTATVIDKPQETEQTQDVQNAATEVKEPEKPTEKPVEKKGPAKKREKTIPELIAGIPVALRHRKADFDPELFPFCEQIVLDHFKAGTAEEIPEDQRGAVLEFLKNDLISRLKEDGEL